MIRTDRSTRGGRLTWLFATAALLILATIPLLPALVESVD